MMLKEVPIWERPREKALKEGIKSLSTTELLAIILRTGVKNTSVLTVSQQIITKLTNISDLNEITLDELMTIKGIGKTKAITILASIELGLRIVQSQSDTIFLNNPEAIFNYLKNEVRHLKQEQLIALYLNVKGALISRKTLFIGTINAIMTDSKEIFKWAYKHSASAIILVHNHPSGDPTPSLADQKMTENIIKQALSLGFIILDHIIIGKTYFSMKQKTNLFNFTP